MLSKQMLNKSAAVEVGEIESGKKLEVGLPSPFPKWKNPAWRSNHASCKLKAAFTWECIIT